MKNSIPYKGGCITSHYNIAIKYIKYYIESGLAVTELLDENASGATWQVKH